MAKLRRGESLGLLITENLGSFGGTWAECLCTNGHEDGAVKRGPDEQDGGCGERTTKECG
jgi:hypothetical protein